MTCAGIKTGIIKSPPQHQKHWISPPLSDCQHFFLCYFFFSRRRVEATKLNNNKFWHMEKYFCGESLSSSLLSSQCVRRQRNTKSSPPGPEEEPQTELNDTRSRHETRFIIYRQEISGFSHSTSVFWVKGVEWSGRCYKKATPIFVAHFLLWSPHKLSFLIPEQCFWIHLLQRMHIFFFFCIMSFFFLLRKPDVFCLV